MNKFILKELNKISAPIKKFNDIHFLISKQNKIYEEFEINKCYLIKLENYILNPPPNFTLADNWNNGRIPKSEYLKVYVVQKMGKMIKVDALGVDFISESSYNYINDNYLGLWLPQAGITKIIEIKENQL